MQFSSRICSPLTLCALALPFNSSFSLFLPLLTSTTTPLYHPFIFPPHPSLPSSLRSHRPRESLKFSEIEMRLGSCPATRTPGLENKRDPLPFRCFLPAQVSIDDSHTLLRRTHIFTSTFYTIPHPLRRWVTALGPRARVFPVVPRLRLHHADAVYVCMCYKRSAINHLVPRELCCLCE